MPECTFVILRQARHVQAVRLTASARQLCGQLDLAFEGEAATFARNAATTFVKNAMAS